ncbi:ABC transporter ATP-binding protein [Evansella tamaricis]|uniref:ABC transporter ATP-binding protein n=1 Tax=Evansella tamaricis TaxID=2069301 RepID=A0ABS6JM16_9BACI|nr:ABC transporter ATP-binding protein [Evansella tamaricis]MBU9713348.1 ABC transporter ATP-binding protein [Evansella tamaricis]
MEVIIELRNGITKYKNFQLGPMDLQLSTGVITALIGRNGAGKTTLLEGLSGLSPFQKGDVYYYGTPINFLEPEIRTKMTYISNDIQMYSDYSVKQAIEFVSTLHKNWDTSWVNHWLTVFQIRASVQIHQLSKGMKMKLNLILGLGHRPDVVFLDEPTDGLDSISRQQFFNLLQEYVEQEECTVVMSTHYTKEVEGICDHVIFLKNGMLSLVGEVEEMKESYHVFSVPPKEDLSGVKGIESFTTTSVETKGVIQSQTVATLPNHAVIKKPSLDDIFQYVVENEEGGEWS